MGLAALGALLTLPMFAAASQDPPRPGVIYAINQAGNLLWYRHDGRGDGSFKWASNEGRRVGVGWGDAKRVGLDHPPGPMSRDRRP